MKHNSILIWVTSTLMFASFANAATSNGALDQQLSQLNVKVHQNYTQIQANRKELASDRRDLKTVNWAHNYYRTKNDARLAADEKKISNNNDSIQLLKSNQHKTETLIGNNQRKINSARHAINADDQKIESNYRQISSASQSFESDKAKIQSNSSQINSLQKDYQRMAQEVDGAYANAAAMNALTTPYHVGNLMVTAGVGHHGSADAFAMGASERISDQLTAKIGAAYNDVNSSMTTFLGFGYEF